MIKSRRKKIKYSFIPTLLLLLLSLQASAEKATTIATFAQMPPFAFRGVISAEGFDVDLIRAIAQKQGRQIKIRIYPFGYLAKGLNSNTIDLVVISLLETPQRRQDFEITVPYASTEDALLYLNPDIQPDEDSDLKHLSIAA